MTKGGCVFCGSGLKDEILIPGRTSTSCECDFCGKYIVDRFINATIRGIPSDNIAKIRAYLIERALLGRGAPYLFEKQSEIKDDSPENSLGLDSMIDAFPKVLDERINRALLNLNRRQKHLGDSIKFLYGHDYPMVFGLTEAEGLYIIKQLTELEYLESNLAMGAANLTISPKGMAHLYQLEAGKWGPLNKQVFVAMAFKEELGSVYENGIKKAIEDDCGYTAYRVDKAEHNERIDDLIISEIKRSKFLVADLTFQRNGVYFEAGMMTGLGRPVIFTVKEEDADNVHFDTRQYKQIRWKNAADLREQLHRRIAATIIE